MANQCDGKPFLNVTTCESDAESYCQCADASIIDAAVKKVEACCGSLKTGDATKDGIEMAKCALKVKSTGYKACSN